MQTHFTTEYMWNSCQCHYEYSVRLASESSVVFQLQKSSDLFVQDISVALSHNHAKADVFCEYRNGFTGVIHYCDAQLQSIDINTHGKINIPLMLLTANYPKLFRINPRRLYAHWLHVVEGYSLLEDSARNKLLFMLTQDESLERKCCAVPTIETTHRIMHGARNEKELNDYFVSATLVMPTRATQKTV